MNMPAPKQSTDEQLREYHASMIKCFNVAPPMIVWVQLHNVKSITWEFGDVALVWLKDQVPIGVNATVGVLQLYREDALPIVGLPAAVKEQAP